MGNEAQKTPSILTSEQEGKLRERFFDLVARAEKPEPQLSDYKGDADAYSRALSEYQSNPLQGLVTSYKKEFDDNLKKGTSFEDSKKLYDLRISKLEKGFVSGIQKGGADPDAERRQNGMLDSLMQGDFMGAIKQFVLSIPFVGDFIAGALKFARAKMNGESLSWSQAQENIKLERSLKGAAANLGVDEGAMVGAGISAVRDPNFKRTERPMMQPPKPSEQTLADASGALDPAKRAGIGGIDGSGPSGVLPNGRPATPATPPAQPTSPAL